MAKTIWGNADPVGGKFRPTALAQRVYTVVGVVGDVRSTTLNQESPSAYYPIDQRVWPLMDVVVRTDVPPTAVLPMIRQKVRELDSDLPIATVRTMEDWISNSAAQPRLSALLVVVFATMAIAIAAVGIYGVLAYSVNQRTREIGVRMALGASRDGVVRLVVREGLTLAAIGIGVGLLGAVGLGRAIGTLVYGIAPRDPFTFLATALVLGTVALIACALPSWRAARVDPTIALREE
jgi:ABC-type antimicrobial peptide transport system permease subunit